MRPKIAKTRRLKMVKMRPMMTKMRPKIAKTEMQALIHPWMGYAPTVPRHIPIL